MHSTIIAGGNLKEQEHLLAGIVNSLDIHSSDTLTIQESTVGIADIRKIKQWLTTKALVGKHKLVVIYRADNMTPQAQNALLKTLEEPEQSQCIVLLTQTLAPLLPTVISRCRVLYAATPITNQMEEKKEYGLAFDDLERLTLGQKILVASKLAEDKTRAQAWVTSALVYFHCQLTKYPTQKKAADPHDLSLVKLTGRLRHLVHFQRVLKTNTNLKLSLEELLFHWQVG